MTAANKRILLKAIKSRMKQGEQIKEIFNSYPKLPYEDKKELKKELAE